MSQGKRKSPGRPPNPKTREKILRAAHALLVSEGFGRLTVESVAAKAGVGKPTIYRYWANAQELALAALLAREHSIDAADEDAAPRLQLRMQIKTMIQGFSTQRGRQIANALAASDPASELSRAFRHQVILASREDGRRIIEVGVAAGDWQAPAHIDALLDMIYGAIFYRLLVGHLPLNDGLADELSDQAERLLRAT